MFAQVRGCIAYPPLTSKLVRDPHHSVGNRVNVLYGQCFEAVRSLGQYDVGTSSVERAHAGAMNIGEWDGRGLYGLLDEDAEGLLCHECGRRFAHRGLHAWKGHGLTGCLPDHRHP